MSSENGTKSKVETHGCKLIKMINYMFWAEQVEVDPFPG